MRLPPNRHELGMDVEAADGRKHTLTSSWCGMRPGRCTDNFITTVPPNRKVVDVYQQFVRDRQPEAAFLIAGRAEERLEHERDAGECHVAGEGRRVGALIRRRRAIVLRRRREREGTDGTAAGR